MTGIICALPGVVTAAAAAAASWQNWTGSDVTAAIRTVADTGMTNPRSIEGVNFASNDNFFVVYSDIASPFYIEGSHKYSRSNDTVAFDSRTTVATTMPHNFTNSNRLTLPSFDKVLLFNAGSSALVATYTSSALTIPATAATTSWSSIVTGSDYTAMRHPTDDTIIMMLDLVGNIQLLSFDDGTDAITVTTNTTTQSNKVSGGNNGHGFWTETAGVYKFAFVYWDNSATSWKVRHYAADLASYTDTTLNATPAFNNSNRLFADHLQPVNKCLCVVKDNTNNVLPCFVVSWNGTNFTQNSTGNIAAPDATYVDPRFIKGIAFLDDDVWAVMMNWNDEGGDAFLKQYVGIFKADGSNNVTNLGWLQLNADSTGAGDARMSIAISANKDYALLIGDDLTNGVAVRMIYRS